MRYNYRPPYENELYHHGILGMKWGTRNGPPYPLDPSDHSASEKKAGWRKSLDGGSSSQVESKTKKTRKTLKGNYHRTIAAMNEFNARYYEKHGNKQMASMNRYAAKTSRKMADEADKEASNKANDRKKNTVSRGKKAASKVSNSKVTVKDVEKKYPSLKGDMNRLYAKVFELNARTYEKMGNKQMASMNRAAAEQRYDMAEEADKKKKNS